MIVNPRSGVDKNKDGIIESAVRLGESRGLRMNVEFTSAPGDARELAAQGASRGVKTVIAAGGDGTVKDVADGLWQTETVMGVVPVGSGNGLARSLGIPQEPLVAIATAIGGHFVAIDRGRANGGTFYSAFGIGFDAEVSYQFSLDKRRGRTTYIKHALRQLFTYAPGRFKMASGDVSVETEALLIAVCNCMQYGNNAYISPKAVPTDGMLDVTVVHQGNFLAKTMAGIDLFSGMLDRNILVEMFRSGSLEIRQEGVERSIVHLDGEPSETVPEIAIRCERGGLRVAVPEGGKPFRPILTPMKSLWEDLMRDIRKNLQQEN